MSADKHDSKLILSIGIILSIVRVLFSSSDLLDYIVAAINIVAFDYIVWCTIYDSKHKLIEQNKKSKLGNRIAIHKQELLNKYTGLFEILLFFILSPIYLIFYSNATTNDVISIIALCLSIETNSFSTLISNMIFSIK